MASGKTTQMKKLLKLPKDAHTNIVSQFDSLLFLADYQS